MRVGSADYTKRGTVVRVTNIKKHPNWNTNTLNADYAILHLLDDVVGLHDGLVTTALLPETDPAETSGLSVRVAGWGKLDSSAKTLPTIPTHQRALLYISVPEHDEHPLIIVVFWLMVESLSLGSVLTYNLLIS